MIYTCIILKYALNCEYVHETPDVHVPVPLLELLVVIDMMQTDGETTETKQQKYHYHTHTHTNATMKIIEQAFVHLLKSSTQNSFSPNCPSQIFVIFNEVRHAV